jgi:hypothetical protein
MTVSTVLTALQSKHAGITGIRKAPVIWPGNLATASLPIVLTQPAEAQWSFQAIELHRSERVYLVRCFVNPVAQDKAGPENSYTTCVTLLDLFGAAYLNDVTLGGVADTMTALSDSGVMTGGPDLTWGDVPYWGFTFRVTVIEKTV